MKARLSKPYDVSVQMLETNIEHAVTIRGTTKCNHVCMYVYACIYTHIYIYTYMRMYHVCTHVSAYTPVYISIHMHADVVLHRCRCK